VKYDIIVFDKPCRTQECSHTGVFPHRCVHTQVCSHTGVFTHRCVHLIIIQQHFKHMYNIVYSRTYRTDAACRCSSRLCTAVHISLSGAVRRPSCATRRAALFSSSALILDTRDLCRSSDLSSGNRLSRRSTVTSRIITW